MMQGDEACARVKSCRTASCSHQRTYSKALAPTIDMKCSSHMHEHPYYKLLLYGICQPLQYALQNHHSCYYKNQPLMGSSIKLTFATMKLAPTSLAIIFATRVLPHPSGPYISTPVHTFIPSAYKFHYNHNSISGDHELIPYSISHMMLNVSKLIFGILTLEGHHFTLLLLCD